MKSSKTTSDFKMDPVLVTRSGPNVYIHLFLNEVELEGENEGKYEYDHNEIVGPVSEINVEDILSNPSKYLDYEYHEMTSEELLQQRLDAMENTYNGYFDGLKMIADPDNPFELRFPMYLKANMYYRYNGVRYVAVQNGLVTEDKMADMLEQF